MKDIQIVYRQPSVIEYSHFRDVAGWGVPEEDLVKKSIENGLFSVCIEKEDKLIGFGRISGDGLYLYVQDVIVLPEYRGKGYASLIMEEIMKYIHKNAKKASFVGLFAAKGVEEFYKKYGFILRPNDHFGHGMCFIKGMIEMEEGR